MKKRKSRVRRPPWMIRRGLKMSGHFRQDGSRRRDGIGQLRGELVSGAKLTDKRVVAERKLAKRVRARFGEIPLGWTSLRAEQCGVSRNCYERAIYGENYRHVPGALVRPRKRARSRAAA